MGDLGEWVGPRTPILELVATDRLRLDLRVPQRYYGRVGTGTAVRIRLDARPEAPLVAELDRTVAVTDPEARTFLARVELDNADRRLTPGMSARATLRIDTGRSGVVVPRDALIRYPDGRVTVWVATGESGEREVAERRVRTGLVFGERVAIREGLRAGEPVVVRGNEALRDGQNVRVRDGRDGPGVRVRDEG
jgi:RND family efflux transporter MFP subunit